MAVKRPSISDIAITDIENPENDRVFKYMKYAHIIDLIAEKQQIPLDEAMYMLYSSPLFEHIDDSTANLICRSDLYLAKEIIRMNLIVK